MIGPAIETALVMLSILALKIFDYIKNITFLKCTIFVIIILILSFINFKYLNSTLIYNNTTSSGTVYIFVLTTVMLFSIDIAVIQMLGKKLKNIENDTYLGLVEIDFLYDKYFWVHNFMRSDLFYIVLVLFSLFPSVGFNSEIEIILESNGYFTFYLFALSIWQILTLFIIIMLIDLIVSDFSMSKHVYAFSRDKQNEPVLHRKIRNRVKVILNEKLLISKDKNSFNKFLSKLYNRCQKSIEQVELIKISYNVLFNTESLFGLKSQLYTKRFSINLISQYVKLINRNNKVLDDENDALIRKFIKSYLTFMRKLIIYNLSQNSMSLIYILNNLKFHDNSIDNQCYIIPPFMYYIALASNNAKVILKEMLHVSLLPYKMNNNYKDFDFVRENLKEFIIIWLRYVARNIVDKSIIKNDIKFVQDLFPKFFNHFIKTSEFKKSFLINALDSPFTQVIKKDFY